MVDNDGIMEMISTVCFLLLGTPEKEVGICLLFQVECPRRRRWSTTIPESSRWLSSFGGRASETLAASSFGGRASETLAANGSVAAP
ncbi:hypothetical protein ACLOJK_002348 [Asimina triloba]